MEIVLVHGGLHGGWCWEHVLPRLREAGFTASAPDLPGMGQDRTPLSNVTLASTADFLARHVGERQNVLLVGHSMAGPAISECAERVPGHLLASSIWRPVLCRQDRVCTRPRRPSWMGS